MMVNHYKEPAITINDIVLSLGQAITIRVAIENFSSDLLENGIGEDEMGKKMVAEYINRIEEIRDLMHAERK